VTWQILSAVRTPIGRAVKGNLRFHPPDDLGALVVKEALRRAEVDGASWRTWCSACAQPEGEQA
jgi:acetyl-CoA acyltransferase